MNLLALDTSTPRASVALAVASALHVADPAAAFDGGRHGRQLLPMIAGLIRSAGLRPRDLDAIAVGLGPGSYTGLRVGLTAAKTLAFALGRPLVAIDSFEALARGAPRASRVIHVVADAQRGDLYAARFERLAEGADPHLVGPLRVAAMDEWAAALRPGEGVVGPQLDRLRLAWPDHVLRTTGDQSPGPEALVALGLSAVLRGEFADPATLEPLYVRRSAAEDQWAANRPGPK